MRTIELGPVPFEACLWLVRSRNELGRRIARESGGNPALLRALVEEMERRGDAELPASGKGDLLRALVQARLNRVNAEAREVFARLIIADQALPMSLLVHAGTGQGDILALVAQLRREGLARLDGEGDNQGPRLRQRAVSAGRAAVPRLRANLSQSWRSRGGTEPRSAGFFQPVATRPVPRRRIQ